MSPIHKSPPLWKDLVKIGHTELKIGNFQSFTRKPSYSSFFLVLCPDLKNVFFGKIH